MDSSGILGLTRGAVRTRSTASLTSPWRIGNPQAADGPTTAPTCRERCRLSSHEPDRGLSQSAARRLPNEVPKIARNPEQSVRCGLGQTAVRSARFMGGEQVLLELGASHSQKTNRDGVESVPTVPNTDCIRSPCKFGPERITASGDRIWRNPLMRPRTGF